MSQKTELNRPFGITHHNNVVRDITSLFNLTKALEGDVVMITTLSDLPTPINGVYYLPGGKNYFFIGNIDLLGNRIELLGKCFIGGFSSETSFLTSTGLGVGIPLITSNFTLPIQNITFKDVDTCFYIDDDGGANAPLALDWNAVNFLNIPNVGTINDVDNWIYVNSAFLNSSNLNFTGTIGTIGITNSLLSGNGSASNILNITDTANITRRFRIIYTSIIAFGSTVAINTSLFATINTESFILDTINFGGGGTYLTGVDNTSNKALFTNCVGIINTSVNGQMYVRGNSTATIISNTNDFFKVNCITTPSLDNEKYGHSNNRLTNLATIKRKYLVSCTLSFNSANNNVCQFGFYDSKLGGIRQPSITSSTANSSGRAENVTFNCVVQHSSAEFLEIWCRNTTSTANITVTDMNVVITEFK